MIRLLHSPSLQREILSFSTTPASTKLFVLPPKVLRKPDLEKSPSRKFLPSLHLISKEEKTISNMTMTYWLRKFKVLTTCWKWTFRTIVFWKHESSKIMALGVSNAKSYAQPVTCLAIIKTNAETPHVKILTFVTFVTNIQNSEQRFKIWRK